MSAAPEELSYQRALHAAALLYVEQGVAVIPMAQVTYNDKGGKRIQPLIQWEKQPGTLVTTPADVGRWFGPTGPARGLAIATGPSGLLMVDNDNYKPGVPDADPPAGAWVERHIGRGGWHAYLRNPDGARNTAGKVSRGVDTRGVGGLSIAAPTRCQHPDGHYSQWQTELPLGQLATAALPAAAESFTQPAPRRLPSSTPGSATELTPARAQAAVDAGRDEWLSSVQGGRHQALIAYLGSLARMLTAQGLPTQDVAAQLEAAAEEHPDAIAGEVFESVPDALTWALDKARAEPWVLVEPTGFEARFSAPLGAAPVAPATGGGLPTLAAEVWSSRPVLAHIREAAWSRRLSPDAVLHAVLARLAAGRRASILIDSGIETSSLNYFAAIIGASGTGKSRAWKLAGELLSLGPDDCPTKPLGSGEGFSEAFMGVIETIDNPEAKKSTKLRVQIRHNVLFELDEGQALTAMLQRSGATIGPVLRSAWSGSVLGQQNADSERNRRVSDYATGLVAGFQPDSMEALLADTHTGMPQRFAYAAATDPAMPKARPSHPGALPVDLSGVLKGGASNPFGNGSMFSGEIVTVPSKVTDEIDAVLLSVADGTVALAELDSQRVGSMLRLSGLLALLEGRFEVSDSDWTLAGALWTVSAAVRDALVSRAAEAAERARAVADGHFATRQVTAAVAVDGAPKAVRRVATRIAQHVHAEGELSLGAARHMLASRDRHLFEAAIEFGAGEAWLVASSSALTPGGSKPSE